jgi:hypothetical protein
VLSEHQVEAIRRYIKRSYHIGYGATKPMVYEAICELKRRELLAKEAPSQRWFQSWIKTQEASFHTLKTKPIERS